MSDIDEPLNGQVRAFGNIELNDLFKSILYRRYFVLSVTLIISIVSVVFSLLMKDIYRAEAVLVPAEVRQSGSPLANQLGGAAALLGISVAEGDSSRVENALAILQSRDFIIRFIKKRQILVPLFAEKWNAKSRNAYIDSSIFDEVTGEWKTIAGAPSDWQAFRAFSAILSVETERSSGLIKIGIEWHNPVQAQQWVNALIQDINDEVKFSDLEEARNAIRYLERQLQETQLIEMQRVFYSLIESQTRISMLADVRDEYVFQVIDPALVPDQRISPNRPLIIVVATLSGFVIGILLIVLEMYFGKHLKTLIGRRREVP